MSASFDVAIIGAGITGVSAALAAHHRGARVCVIRTSPGASALVSGAWRGPLRNELRSALAGGGLPLEAAGGALAHERGLTVTCEFAGASHARATPTPATLVCGIYGLPHFNADALARMWAPQPLAARTITLAGTPASGWTTLSLASHIEQNPAVLTEQLPREQPLLLPPVLGVEKNAQVMVTLMEAGVQAAEALAASPSIPGWRMLRAIDHLLTAHGIPLMSGRAQIAASTARRITALRVNETTINARNFILASGKFTGGGLRANAEFHETVFNLPVWIEHLGGVFESADALPLTDPVRTEQQPLLTVGVSTQADLRPVNRAGDVVYENLFAAGTIRAGWNAAYAGLGHCAEDGWMAGVNAST